MAKGKSETLIDVAKYAGVSIATVSRYLNGVKVRPELAAKVADAVEKFDYRLNPAARLIKGQKSGTIGLILPELDHPYFAALLEGAAEQAREFGQNILVGSCHGKHEVEEQTIDQFAHNILDGLIYTPVAKSVNLIEIEAFRELPVVIAARDQSVYPQLPHVYQDTHGGGYLSTKYLLSLGHRKIAFFASFWEPDFTEKEMLEILKTPGTGVYSSLNRFRGYLDALEEFGVEYDPRLVIKCSYGFEDGKSSAKHLLSRMITFDSIVTASDYVACGVIDTLEAQGISVPNDVSVMGYGDLELSKMIKPQLSTIHQNMFEIGKQSVRSLYEVIHDRTAEDIMLDVELVVRDSTSKKDT
ncbi:MAG: LacI family transcriptional regulator [Spirochaetia bacterium]|nr:LacI family transcriptional regulator [Spirochaetia bacterium]